MKNTIEILERMNAWRRSNLPVFDGGEMPCPKEFGLAIDDAVRKLKAADEMAGTLAKVIEANCNEGVTSWNVEDAIDALAAYRA